MFNLVISITLANKAPRVSQIMSLFLEKTRNIQDLLESFFGKVLIILDFFSSIAGIFYSLKTVRFFD